MLRKLLAAIAALAASACAYGSAVDLAPISARLAKPVLSPGDYCEVQGETAPFRVISSEDCVPLTWSKDARTYTMIDLEDPEESMEAAIVSLGQGLYLGQVEVETDKPDKYQIQVFIAKGSAFAIIPALSDDELKQLASQHPRVGFRNDSTGRPYIVSGTRDRIKTFLVAASKESLREMKAEKETLSVGVLDTAGVADHDARANQARDIEDVLRVAKSLTPR
ncbi:MAG TPA: hypothetical protein VIA80_05990 [Hyphomonadaceae bacterium]|jgi:hypothetical protein